MSTRIRFHSVFTIVSGNGAIVFYSLEDTEQYKNARKTYTCGWGLSKHDGNVLRNKRIVHTKQRERIISSPNEIINNVLVL